jgi:hypothetical protein
VDLVINAHHLVEVRDETGLGVGAVTRAILVGDPDYSDCKFVDTFEVFDQEDDFEDYQICDPVDDVGYGTRYDADGKPIGDGIQVYMQIFPKIQLQERYKSIKTSYSN